MAKVKTANYEVELKHTTAVGAKRTAWRAGRQFEVKKPVVVELTEEEVKAFEDDKRFSIKKTTKSPEQANSGEETSGSEADSQGGDSGSSDSDTDSEGEDSEDQGSDDQEEDSDEDSSSAPTVDELVRDNGRDELNAMATEAGVKDAEKMENKTEVAQAIVEAQAQNADGGATS